MHDGLADKSHASLIKASAYLTSQQSRDGGWHSQTYGQLKDGAAVTSLAQGAIGFLPAADRQKLAGPIQRGFAFLDPGLLKRKTVASPDGSLDFPTYAAALWLASRRRLGLEFPPAPTALLRDYLLAAQVAEDRGFDAGHPQYGGWDFLGKEDAQGITTGTNVSVTRFVLAALHALPEAGPPVAAAIARARPWLLRCQQDDGGFCFTTEPMSLNNKAGFADEKQMHPRSYGTATCDAILALLATGENAQSEPVRKGVSWLVDHKGLELVPGFENLPPELGWQRGLRFYYYAALSQVLPLFPEPERSDRRDSLRRLLVAAQQADGSFVNDSDRMRENDPLIATSLAIMALGEISSHDQ